MSLSIFSCILALIIPLVVFMAAFFLSARSSQDREKMSPFECGFDPKSSARIPFSLRFFLLAVLFLVFDIEIVLLMPIPISMNFFFFSSTLSIMLFLLVLIVGLLHEWREGSLDWTK